MTSPTLVPRFGGQSFRKLITAYPSYSSPNCAEVAGSTLAYWLARHDFQVDKESTFDGPAFEIVKLMGILDKINEKTTGEEGFAVADEQSRSCGIFEADGFSLIRSIGLMRGDLTEILYNAADEPVNVTFQFETTVQSLRQIQNKVIVDLENKDSKIMKAEEFDLIIGADGIRSRTRQLVISSPEKLNCLKFVDSFVVFFSIPKEDQD